MCERRDDDGALVGYSVALPGDRADGGSRPVWFAGSTLAYDLSLPRVRERGPPPGRHLLEGQPVLHRGRPSRGRDPALPDDPALGAGRARVPHPGLPGGGSRPLHDHARRRGPRAAGPDGSRRSRPPAAGRTGQGRGGDGGNSRTRAVGLPGGRGPGAGCWGALPGRDRIGFEGLLLTGALFAAAWRTGHFGLVQADFVLSVLSGTVGVATLYRGAVWRPEPAPPVAEPLVAPSEEVQRHAAREAGTATGAWPGKNCEEGGEGW
ncbi:hypothetical protein ACIBEA_30485 [Streptomyces sp. NPDC051555]|uniref:hypothetical protein n=1 Tax=Streptomyces sp. NPDC051555 TaxID=3365657 RepID=UPI0037AD4994